MSFYSYKAYDSNGKLHRGNLFVDSEEEAISFLLRNNLTPVEVKLIPESLIYNLFFKLFFRIKYNQKIYLLRSIHLIIKSGLSLDKGLNILAVESKGALRDFIYYLIYNLYKGEPIYKTFAEFPQFFSQVEVETIKSGEISGNLVKNLENLIGILELQKDIKSELISSLIYPIIVLGLSFGVIILLFTFVMPKIGVLLKQLTSKPPLLTKILITLSDFINANFQILTFIFVVIIITLIVLFSLKKFRSFLIKIFLNFPIVSNAYFTLSLSQSFFILRHLLSSGINLVDALQITANASYHYNIKEAFTDLANKLRQGKRFINILTEDKRLPLFASNVLSIAYEAGFLEDTLKVLEDYYLSEFKTSIKRLLNFLQPAILVLVGVIVGIVAVSVLVPIYQQISQQLQMQEGRGQIPGELR